VIFDPLREENDNALADNEVIIGWDNDDTLGTV
jgi:hypothetical protein